MSESAGQHSGWLLDTEVRGEGEVQGDLGSDVLSTFNFNDKYDNYDEIIALIVQSTIYCNHLSQTFFYF